MGSLLPLKAWGGVGLGRRHTGNGADCEQQAADTTGRELLYGIWHWHCANVAAYVPKMRDGARVKLERRHVLRTHSLSRTCTVYGVTLDTYILHTTYTIIVSYYTMHGGERENIAW